MNKRQLGGYLLGTSDTVRKRRTSFGIVLSEGMNPSVCNMIQRLNTRISGRDIYHLPDRTSRSIPNDGKVMMTLSSMDLC